MKKQLLCFSLLFAAVYSQAQQSVRTGSGDEHILYPNGTWGKVAESINGKKVILMSNGTWKDYDLTNTTVVNPINTTNGTTTITNPNTTVVPDGPSVAQVSDNVLTVWKNSKLTETIKLEYEYDMKSTYYYSIACAPYRYNKTTGEVWFMATELLGKATNAQEAQSFMGNHYTQFVYKGTTAKLSSDATSLSFYAAGNEVRKVTMQRVYDMANDAYNFTMEGNSYRYGKTSGEIKLPSGEVLGKAANEKEAKCFIAYHYVYKK